MILKGIARGDKTFRHFSFDDEDVIIKDGTPYYKITYDKNPIEGEYGEEEMGYIPCDQVMPLGGRKPKPIERGVTQTQPKNSNQISTQTQIEEVESIDSTEKKKRGRPSSKPRSTPSLQNQNGEMFEYCVEEFHSGNINILQDQLNEMGVQGWELCGFNTDKSLFGEIHIIVVFKRKK